MNALSHIDREHLHHAYIIENTDDVFATLPAYLTEKVADAELYVREYESLGIDDSRELMHLAGMRSVGTQLFVYKVGTLTREAQNALLKLFEEPPARTHFFFCVGNAGSVVPTLLSRVRTILGDGSESEDVLVKEFIQATSRDRLAILEPIIKEKDIATAEVLLNALEATAFAQRTHLTNPSAVKHLIAVRRALHTNGAPLKVLMESASVLVPAL